MVMAEVCSLGCDFGVRLERNVIVTKDGFIPLDLFPFEEEAIGG